MNKSIITTALIIVSLQFCFAQNKKTAIAFDKNEHPQRSGIMAAGEHAIGFSTGINYSILPLQLNYKRGFNFFQGKYPINLGIDLGIPIFAFDLKDSRIKITTEALLLRKSNFEIRGGVDPKIVTLNMDTEQMLSLGVDAHLFVGLTSYRWNIGAEFTFDKIFSTHIKHSAIYRELVFSDALDGWYKNTASNIRIGMLINRSLNRFNVFLNGGISKTGKFNDYLFVPTMYALVGVNYRL